MEEFIKFDRGLTDWEWYKNKNTKCFFVHCLLKAYPKDTKIEGKIIPRGSFVSSTKKLSDELGMTLAEIRTAIKHLKSTNELTSKGTNKNTVFTVVNYDLYQSKEQAERLMNSKQIANEQQIEEEIQERENNTTKQVVSSTGKKKAKEEKHKYGEYQHVLLTDTQYQRLCNDYGDIEVHEAIKFLDEYIQMKGYKAKDHNLALRKWVFRAVEEEKSKNNQQRTGSSDDYWNGI